MIILDATDFEYLMGLVEDQMHELTGQLIATSLNHREREDFSATYVYADRLQNKLITLRDSNKDICITMVDTVTGKEVCI